MKYEIEDDSYVLGIDLGTSNSCAAVMKNNEALVIQNELGLLLTPSYVTFLENQERLVGQFSKLNILSKKNTVFYSKRLIGKNFSDKSLDKLKEDKSLPFEIIEDKKSQKIKIGIEINEKEKSYFYPEQISSIILRKIKEDAENFLSRIDNKRISIKKVVITTPANFNQNQRKATKQAAEIANLEVIGMINEPTAASLAYGLHKIDKEDEKKRIVVLDFGGGTLDFTLLKFTKNKNGIYCDVEGTYGDPNFGGEDFDKALMEAIINENNIFNNINNYQYLRLKRACEKAKIKLSYKEDIKIILEEFLPSFDINKTITRKEFLDKICKSLFTKFENKLKDFINYCDIQKKKPLIKDIILIGGSTKLPKIKQILIEEFPKAIIRDKDLDPMISVAKGAAIRASMIENPDEYSIINLFDITNLSLGTNEFNIEKNRDIMSVIIKRNTQLPAFGQKTYKTKEDNQTKILNNIYEGESEELSENLFLGTFTINIPPRKKGQVKINLSFEINKHSILEVKAKEVSNENNFVKLTITENQGIEENELSNLKIIENNIKIIGFLEFNYINSEYIDFQKYNKIKDNILENQRQINLGKGQSKDLYLKIINDLIFLLEKADIDKINREKRKEIYISSLKYLFNVTMLFLDNHIDISEDFKTKFKDIFLSIQFINDNNNILFELLEDIRDNYIIYQYCLSVIIENYNSRMKELFFKTLKTVEDSENKFDFRDGFKKCNQILLIIKNLLKKLTLIKLIEPGILKEIVLFEDKINIKEIILNYKYRKINFTDLKNKLFKFNDKITKNVSFFHNEIKELSEINYTLNQSKLEKNYDAKYLYELVKFHPPYKKLPYNEIKKEEYIDNEIEKFTDNFNKGKKSEEEKDKKNESLFRQIFCKEGVLLTNKENITSYIKKRIEIEKNHKGKNDNLYYKYDKYIRDFYSIREYFLEDPYQTIIDLISLYQNSNSEDLQNLIFLKTKYSDINDNIELLKDESNEDEFVFLSSILKKYPPEIKIFRNPHEYFEIKDNDNYSYTIYDVEKFYQSTKYDNCDDKTKFEYFKKICDIYFKSYLVSECTKREYLCVIVALNKIRKDFKNKGFTFNSIFERKIHDPRGVCIYFHLNI